ncbi:hypothetical protein LX16_4105 [Stackebrandtia albiflava]|uniref:Uncharacterized protein n=2 Tax=Stackebrandtia albiflava TaxID=406432 RepID=A0A562UYK0_9ACTN|nr:hypothetical protein LX16_4105 [Stackebrandtia albiflava]
MVARALRERYIVWLPLRRGLSFEVAARRAHDLIVAGHGRLGDLLAAADTELRCETEPHARWRLYGQSVDSVADALRRYDFHGGDRAERP